MLSYAKRFSFLLAIVGLLIFAGVPVAHGQSVVTDTPISAQVFTNSCNGDTVTLSGTAHQEMVFSTNPNGMTHFSMNSTVHMTGAGTPTIHGTLVANGPLLITGNFTFEAGGPSVPIGRSVALRRAWWER